MVSVGHAGGSALRELGCAPQSGHHSAFLKRVMRALRSHVAALGVFATVFAFGLSTVDDYCGLGAR